MKQVESTHEYNISDIESIGIGIRQQRPCKDRRLRRNSIETEGGSCKSRKVRISSRYQQY